MRKTSAYARKRRHLGPVVAFNGAAWMNTIALHRPYDEPTDAAGIEGTADTADRCEMLVRMAAQGLIEGSRPPSPEHDFDRLAHALGVTAIRLKQIDPSNGNPGLPALIAGTAAVARAISATTSRKHGESMALGARTCRTLSRFTPAFCELAAQPRWRRQQKSGCKF